MTAPGKKAKSSAQQYRPRIDCSDVWDDGSSFDHMLGAFESPALALFSRLGVDVPSGRKAPQPRPVPLGICPEPNSQADIDETRQAMASHLVSRTRRQPVKRARAQIDVNDLYAVYATELQAKIQENPRTSHAVGAWLDRMQGRGAGHVVALPGAEDGLSVLVLDRAAMAELDEAKAAYLGELARYEQLLADLAAVRQHRQAAAGKRGAQ